MGMLTSSSARNRPTRSLAAAARFTPARISSRQACDSPASSAANWFQLISTSTAPVINVSPRTNQASSSPRNGPGQRPWAGSSGGPSSQSQAANTKASSDRPPKPCRVPARGRPFGRPLERRQQKQGASGCHQHHFREHVAKAVGDTLDRVVHYRFSESATVRCAARQSSAASGIRGSTCGRSVCFS